jgi:hypothetical protein
MEVSSAARATWRLRNLSVQRAQSRPRAIIDIESSGLGPDSWPVAVAWHVLETGVEGHLLIKPEPGWHGWQHEAEAIHSISQARLQADGLPLTEVARRLAGALDGTDVHSDAPALDQGWLDMIFAADRTLSAPSVRRYGDLFPAATRQEYQACVQRAGEQTAPWKALSDVRQLAAAVAIYRSR